MESAARNDVLNTLSRWFSNVSQNDACGNARGGVAMMSTRLVSMMFVCGRRVSGELGGPAALTPPPQLWNAREGAGKQSQTSCCKNMRKVRRG